jgi:hypothetical protein
MQLVDRIPNSEPDREAIAMQVRSFIEKAKSALDKLDQSADEETQPAIDETSVAKLFEEVKVMFQDLPSRIEGRLEPIRHRGRRRLHPMMVEEILHMSEIDDSSGLLVILGMLRDDFPWLYEIGLEAHRAIKGGSPAQIRKAGESFQRALDLTLHGPFARESHDKETYFVVRESMEIFDRFLYRAIERSEKIARRKKPSSKA